MSMQQSKISRVGGEFSWIWDGLASNPQETAIPEILKRMGLLDFPTEEKNKSLKIAAFLDSLKRFDEIEETILTENPEKGGEFVRVARAEFCEKWKVVLAPPSDLDTKIQGVRDRWLALKNDPHKLLQQISNEVDPEVLKAVDEVIEVVNNQRVQLGQEKIGSKGEKEKGLFIVSKAWQIGETLKQDYFVVYHGQSSKQMVFSFIIKALLMRVKGGILSDFPKDLLRAPFCAMNLAGIQALQCHDFFQDNDIKDNLISASYNLCDPSIVDSALYFFFENKSLFSIGNPNGFYNLLVQLISSFVTKEVSAELIRSTARRLDVLAQKFSDEAGIGALWAIGIPKISVENPWLLENLIQIKGPLGRPLWRPLTGSLRSQLQGFQDNDPAPLRIWDQAKLFGYHLTPANGVRLELVSILPDSRLKELTSDIETTCRRLQVKNQDALEEDLAREKRKLANGDALLTAMLNNESEKVKKLVEKPDEIPEESVYLALISAKEASDSLCFTYLLQGIPKNQRLEPWMVKGLTRAVKLECLAISQSFIRFCSLRMLDDVRQNFVNCPKEQKFLEDAIFSSKDQWNRALTQERPVYFPPTFETIFKALKDQNIPIDPVCALTGIFLMDDRKQPAIVDVFLKNCPVAILDEVIKRCVREGREELLDKCLKTNRVSNEGLARSFGYFSIERNPKDRDIFTRLFSEFQLRRLVVEANLRFLLDLMIAFDKRRGDLFDLLVEKAGAQKVFRAAVLGSSKKEVMHLLTNQKPLLNLADVLELVTRTSDPEIFEAIFQASEGRKEVVASRSAVKGMALAMEWNDDSLISTFKKYLDDQEETLLSVAIEAKLQNAVTQIVQQERGEAVLRKLFQNKENEFYLAKSILLSIQSGDQALLSAFQRCPGCRFDKVLEIAVTESLSTVVEQISDKNLDQLSKETVRAQLNRSMDRLISGEGSTAEIKKAHKDIANALFRACYQKDVRISQNDYQVWIGRGLQSKTPQVVYSLIFSFLDQEYVDLFLLSVLNGLCRNPNMTADSLSAEIAKLISTSSDAFLLSARKECSFYLNPVLFSRIFVEMDKRVHQEGHFIGEREREGLNQFSSRIDLKVMLTRLGSHISFLWDYGSEETCDSMCEDLLSSGNIHCLKEVLRRERRPTIKSLEYLVTCFFVLEDNDLFDLVINHFINGHFVIDQKVAVGVMEHLFSKGNKERFNKVLENVSKDDRHSMTMKFWAESKTGMVQWIVEWMSEEELQSLPEEIRNLKG